GSSAAVTVAATALALADSLAGADPQVVRATVLKHALAAHATAQEAMGARGSGADIAAAVYGGALAFELSSHPRPSVDIALFGGDSTGSRSSSPQDSINVSPPATISISHERWPATVRLLPFFTG